MALEFAKISSAQLSDLPREKTVIFIPVGPLEDHGPHLPMGLDLEEAHRICHAFAEAVERQMNGWVGVILPAAPLGIQTNTSPIAVKVRAYVLRDWLVDASVSLRKMGFFHFVCVSGHWGPRQLTAIEEAGQILQKSNRLRRLRRFLPGPTLPLPTLLSASSNGISAKEVFRSPFWSRPLEHGGKRDTSMALFLNPSLVDSNYLKLPAIPKTKDRKGYWGDPARGSALLGAQEVKRIVEEGLPKMRAIWEGSPQRSLFRSWYSIFPFNKSFFKSWILAGMIVLMMFVWVYLSLEGLHLDSL